MNWWLIIYLSLFVVGSAVSMTKAEDGAVRLGALIGFLLSVFLLYMSGVFTLL